MGTIHIKNLSTKADRAVCAIVGQYWIGEYSLDGIEDRFKITIKKKGHTFTVVDLEKR